MMMSEEEVLNIFTETQALLSGHFQLRSGLHSDQFFQCALVLRYPRIAAQLCETVVNKMCADLKDDMKIDGVIAPALGGIPVGHEVARALGVRSIFAEKQEDGLILRRGFKIKPGERFVIAEDVITRGGRVQQTIDIVQQNEGIVAGIVVLVDRSGGLATFDAPHWSLLQMTPTTWEADECPLCKQGVAIDKPGSK